MINSALETVEKAFGKDKTATVSDVSPIDGKIFNYSFIIVTSIIALRRVL